MDYILHIMVFIGIYAILAVSLDLLVGHTGLLSIAHAAFYGIGAYASALLVLRLGAPFWIGVLAGMAAGVVFSVIVSLPSMRLHGDHFVIATLAFQIILVSILNNWIDVTRGPLGLEAIPGPTILGFEVSSQFEFLLLTAAFLALSYACVYRIASSPLGRVLRAIREDEVFPRSLGKNTLRFKVTAYAISAALASSAGALFAHYVTYIDPSSFTVMESILLISMVIIGGAASSWGPLIGAAVLVGLQEGLRFVGLPGALAANLRQIIYGSLLVVMMILRPRGLAGRYGFGR